MFGEGCNVDGCKGKGKHEIRIPFGAQDVFEVLICDKHEQELIYNK